MAGHKETPRQKMIGMMYLVLTALLALNVSSDLLNAFVIVNDSIMRTNENFRNKNLAIYDEFKGQYDLKPGSVGPFYKKAQKVKELSEKLVKQIQDVQNQVIGYTEYESKTIKVVKYKKIDPTTKKEVELTANEPRLVPLANVVKRDNFDKPMIILLGNSDKGTAGEATKIKNAIIKYKKEVADLIADSTTTSESIMKQMGIDLDPRFNPKAGMEQSWELSSFYNCPLAADMILLNKLIADISNIESESVTRLMANIVKEKLKFDNVVARVIPKSTVVVSGEAYEADFIVAAYSSTESPTVLLKTGTDKFTSAAGARTLNKASGDVVDGVVHYKVPTGGMGDQKYAGVIQITKDDGEVKSYDFNGAYTVIRPSATVSADKMNVVYQGLQNPISISAAGFTNDKLTLTVSGGGTLSNKGNGKFEYLPAKTMTDIKFSVTGRSMDGKTTALGGFTYRVKPLPSPITRISGIADGGVLDRSLLGVRPVVTSMLENFLFDGLNFTVTSFELQVTNPKKSALIEPNVAGGKVPGNVIDKIRTFPAGSKLMILNVKVNGPNGPTRAASVSVTLN